MHIRHAQMIISQPTHHPAAPNGCFADIGSSNSIMDCKEQRLY